MKTKIITLVMCSLLLGAIGARPAHAGPVGKTNSTRVSGDWEKSKNIAWPGMKFKTQYWYKLDKKRNLLWTRDGKKWTPAPDGMWLNKKGMMIKIQGDKLMWSADNLNWAEESERKWQGPKGEWYKFDKKWVLWVMHP